MISQAFRVGLFPQLGLTERLLVLEHCLLRVLQYHHTGKDESTHAGSRIIHEPPEASVGPSRRILRPSLGPAHTRFAARLALARQAPVQLTAQAARAPTCRARRARHRARLDWWGAVGRRHARSHSQPEGGVPFELASSHLGSCRASEATQDGADRSEGSRWTL